MCGIGGFGLGKSGLVGIFWALLRIFVIEKRNDAWRVFHLVYSRGRVDWMEDWRVRTSFCLLCVMAWFCGYGA
jgi:hypothetical protein